MPSYSDNIIPKVDRALLKQELNEQTFVRKTNKIDNEIYIVNHLNSPNVLKEIGRLRELTFRAAGGGTGNPIDLDKYDTSENYYSQLIVYSPQEQEIVGGYRFIRGTNCINKNGEVELSTVNYFNLSDKFKKEYLPYTIELGRSWIQPMFQPKENKKGLFALDNLWDGLGALVVDNPDVKYLYGKVTMYPDFNIEARDCLLSFLNYFFPDKDGLLKPIYPLKREKDFTSIFEGKDFKEAYKELNSFVRERDENIPPLINSYMGLSSTMKTFGTAVNPDFGGVEETGILVTIADIFPEKKERHISTYKS